MSSAKNLQDYFEIIRGTHPDPFSVLGMHIEQAAESDVVVVRAFRPDAKKVAVIDLEHQKEFPMQLIHETGFYELIVPNRSKVFAYKLKVSDEEGNSIEIVDPYSFLPVVTEFDRHLFFEGKNYRVYEKFGAHPMTVQDVQGTYFCVWAPNARRVSVVGDFNYWDGSIHVMRNLGQSGIWELFVPAVDSGALYKFEILTSDNRVLSKADPYGVSMQQAPETSNIVFNLDGYEWNDQEWMEKRADQHNLDKPISIYEVHLGSWLRTDDNRMLNYRELAHKLVDYVKNMGYTHIELLPVSEHPFYGSWGYQVINYYAPTSRYGNPHDFMYLVDYCHQNGISVLLDWVPAHFPKDEHGLARFDGTALYEHADWRKGEQKDWGTFVYNYGRREVQNFLISNLLYWCELYHLDGFRMDAVASMLYLDYSKNPGEWVPNEYGGRENLEAVEFLRHCNNAVHENYPGVFMIAEESTSWPGVCQQTHLGGLGFDMKWNLGWMNDMLAFMSTDPLYRQFHMDKLTFAIYYAFSENFISVLSHDEVVHGKYSLLNKMPGDLWQRFANLRLLIGYMMALPGKKLLFMGGDIGQQIEWNHDQGLDWHLLQYPIHDGYNKFVKDALHLYKNEEALHRFDFDSEGFEWIDFHDTQNTVVSYMRKTKNPAHTVFFVFNFTPIPRENYRVGVPFKGRYLEILNSDSEYYGGSNVGNQGELQSQTVWAQNQPFSLELNLPPLGMLVFKALDAPQMIEMGPEKQLLKVFTMPEGIEIPKPKKKKPAAGKKSKSSSKKTTKSASNKSTDEKSSSTAKGASKKASRKSVSDKKK